MEDVVGYEEKRPQTLAKIKSGYPRFLVHEFIAQVHNLIKERCGLERSEVMAVCSQKSAQALARFAGSDAARIFPFKDFWVVVLSRDPTEMSRALAYRQHTGCAISSRQAEVALASEGESDGVTEEVLYDGPTERYVRNEIASIYGRITSRDVLLTNCGMSAFHAAYEVVSRIQAERNRRIWIQLGWLYLDTMRILEVLPAEGNEMRVFYDVGNLDELEVFLQEHGGQVAAIVTETPTNPLIETADLHRLRSLADQHAIALILDPTIATPANVDILPLADVIVNSLTKYAASDGDVMIGSLVLNSGSGFYDEFREEVPKEIEPPYQRDLDRLGAQIGNYRNVVTKINQNSVRVAQFLESCPAVKSVYWPYSEEMRPNFEKIERAPQSAGGIITIFLKKPLSDFYDPCRLVKGPSFGTTFSLMCPFMYLAHYDQVSTPHGRRELWDLRLDPDLVRISIGTEPSDQIIEMLGEAL